MHGARGQHKQAGQAHGAGALLYALQDLFTVTLTLALRRHGQRRHLGRLGLGVGVERGAGKDHAVVLDDGVVVGIALDLGAVALDQGAVVFKRLDQLQDGAHVVAGGLAQLFQLFVDHHGANAIVLVNLQEQRAVQRKRQDVAALDAGFAGGHAVLQVKTGVGGPLRGWQVFEQGLRCSQRQLGVDRVVFASRLVGVNADARHFGQKDQFVGLQLNGHAGGNFFHRQVESLARG